MTADPGAQAELLELAGRAASAAAHHDRAEGFLQRAMALHRERGDRGAEARATAALGQALLNTYRTEAALAILEPAAAELGDVAALADDPGLLRLGGQLTRALFMNNLSGRAIPTADAVLEKAERLD